mgnify:CR=1 FL=1
MQSRSAYCRRPSTATSDPYEGHELGGGFAFNVPLSISLGGTFTLVAEEEPGAECPATEPVSVSLETVERSTPFTEIVR